MKSSCIGYSWVIKSKYIIVVGSCSCETQELFVIFFHAVVTMVLNSTSVGAVLSTWGHYLHAEVSDLCMMYSSTYLCLVFMLICLLPLQLGLGLGVIGAVYLPLSGPYVISSIIVGKLTDILVRVLCYEIPYCMHSLENELALPLLCLNCSLNVFAIKNKP